MPSRLGTAVQVGEVRHACLAAGGGGGGGEGSLLQIAGSQYDTSERWNVKDGGWAAGVSAVAAS